MSNSLRQPSKVLSSGLIFSGICALLFAQVFSEPRPAYAARPEVLKHAQDAYGAGRFEEAVEMIRKEVERHSLTGGDLSRGLETMGASYVRLGRLAEADSTFYKLLDQDPTWKVDPDRLRSDEVETFSRARDRWLTDHPIVPPLAQPKGPWWRSKWVAGGATALVACVFLCPDPPVRHSNPLPDPPGPPSGN